MSVKIFLAVVTEFSGFREVGLSRCRVAECLISFAAIEVRLIKIRIELNRSIVILKTLLVLSKFPVRDAAIVVRHGIVRVVLNLLRVLLNSIHYKVCVTNEKFQPLSKIMRGQMTYRLSVKAYEDFPDLPARLPRGCW